MHDLIMKTFWWRAHQWAARGLPSEAGGWRWRVRPAQRRQRRCWVSSVKAACTGDGGREGEEGDRVMVTTKYHHQKESEKTFRHLMDLECIENQSKVSECS